MLKIMPERLASFFEIFPALGPTILKLNGAQIPFLIGGSGCLFLFGNERVPDDVDIYLPDEMHDKADEAFAIKSFTYESPLERVRNSNPKGDHSIQLTSHLRLNILGKTYNLSLNQDVFNQAFEVNTQGSFFKLLPPEDVLLIKALLQRGPEVGKHDIEDIRKFLKIFPDTQSAYLNKRIQMLEAAERVGDIFSI